MRWPWPGRRTCLLLEQVVGQVADVADDLGEIRESLRALHAAQGKQGTQLTGLIERTRHMANQQEQLGAIVAQQSQSLDQISTALTGLQSDVDDFRQQLEDAQNSGETVDLAPLQAVSDRLAALANQATALDAENPAPEPAPVDGQL